MGNYECFSIRHSSFLIDPRKGIAGAQALAPAAAQAVLAHLVVENGVDEQVRRHQERGVAEDEAPRPLKETDIAGLARRQGHRLAAKAHDRLL